MRLAPPLMGLAPLAGSGARGIKEPVMPPDRG